MPLLQNDALPKFDPARLQVLIIHCSIDATLAGQHVQQFGLTFPMVLDFDSELFYRFRIRGQVFPLNVVVDAAGKIVHIGGLLDDAIAAATKAIASP